MKARSILGRKGHRVVTIDASRTVAEAVRLLVEHGIGSVVVMEGDEIAGILTERDVLRLVDRNPSAFGDTGIQEVMTRDLVVALPDDDVAHLMEIMTRNRVRHVPIVSDGTLHGLVSIGDVVNAVRKDAEAENRYLREYVQGMVR
jgi:CBS domain-containing protein